MQALAVVLAGLRVSDPPRVEAARAYARAGVPVFPCLPGGKRPATAHGFQDASTDVRQVDRWWTWLPEANIGLATGAGLDVLDIDVHATGAGYPTLQLLQRAGLVGGWLAAVRTPSGGLHLYYPTDPDQPRRSWSRGTHHVDFRGAGGYVVAPPSRVRQGDVEAGYTIIGLGHDPAPIDGDQIRDLLTPPRPTLASTRVGTPSDPSPVRSSRQLADWLARAQEGTRNASLFWAACRLAELGLAEPDIHELLAPSAQAIGLGASEITATIRSAHRAAALFPTDPPSPPASPRPAAVSR
ncbi:MAG: bifunctional DNA primase/polymerase [Cellulomonas sp.]|uniref:bifunctional DNA primase/polymerase n=1 Tax=Cellulomonas sp. 73-92 TaxID=1895740 RepID=UPI000926EAAF|nr:bifunctional DNA primase/polymerase [Cellulomonas sp. 73-92]MBN9375229.1 bifunctional DNA primase/polymerase [Cellulomonas sp.]OJV75956.1 MAG: hypothetical protein BGO37_06890 [Cellulomonas sp. 73-92]